jgi:hypothetical protein
VTAHVGRAIRQLHEAELTLAAQLRAAAERHADEHDVFHLARTLAEQCDSHAEAFRTHAERHGEAPAVSDDDGLWVGLVSTAQDQAAESPATGLVLLHDLRRLYLLAEEVLIEATMVKQAAMATRDADLLAAVTASMSETEVQVRWLETKIKTAAPQALTIG